MVRVQSPHQAKEGCIVTLMVRYTVLMRGAASIETWHSLGDLTIYGILYDFQFMKATDRCSVVTSAAEQQH